MASLGDIVQLYIRSAESLLDCTVDFTCIDSTLCVSVRLIIRVTAVVNRLEKNVKEYICC